MKKIFLVLILICFFTISCKDDETLLEKASNQISFEVAYDNLKLQNNLEVDGKDILISWESKTLGVSNDGIIDFDALSFNNNEIEIVLSANFSYDKLTLSKDYKVLVKNVNGILDEAVKELNVPNEVTNDINLLKEININGEIVNISYESDNDALTNEGIVTRSNSDITVNLKAVLSLYNRIKEVYYTVTVLGKTDYNEILTKAFDLIEIPNEIYIKFDLPNTINYLDYEIQVNYKFTNDAVKDNGLIAIDETNDLYTDVIVELSIGDIKIENRINNIKIKSFENMAIEVIDLLNIPTEANDDITLPNEMNGLELQWLSSNYRILTQTGKVNYTSKDVQVLLSLVIVLENEYNDYLYDNEYMVLIKPYDALYCIDTIEKDIVLPSETDTNIVLEKEFSYDVYGTWESSNENVISNTGFVNQQTEDVIVLLTLKLSCRGECKTYNYSVNVLKIDLTGTDEYFSMHNLIDRAINFKQENLNNLELNGSKIVLKENALVGEYESIIYKTRAFQSVVASYSCITNKEATAELLVSVRVNGEWSKYFSYGEYGLGRNNLYYDSKDKIAEIATDEINVLNGKSADAIKYKIILKRTSLEEISPQLSLVAMALDITGYTYDVDTSNLPLEKDTDLPKLYQYDVPEIGGSICSATTTTMLLKHKGFNFENQGYDYEHEYMANLVADRGHNNPTYGNWSYNMITAGAFGVDAYCARAYSFNEIKVLLNEVGPIGASVKGYFGSYSTNGHLVVLRGYKETQTGTICIFNDPAVKNVYVELPLETFITCFRGIVYVIE